MIATPTTRPASEAALFPKLSAESVSIWRQYGSLVKVGKGERLITEGQLAYPFYIVLTGHAQAVKILGPREIILANFGTSDFIGDVAMLAGAAASAEVRVLEDSTVIQITNETFRSLVVQGLAESAEVVSALAVRAAEVGAVGRNHEKLASIGRIAAGLAHELNNPAASICRQAAVLSQEIMNNQTISLQASGEFSESQQHLVASMAIELTGCGHASDSLWSQDQAELIEEWMNGRSIRNAVMYAAQLADLGVTVERLQALEDEIGTNSQSAVEWVANTVFLMTATKTIEAGSRRISDIVEKMRHYSHLDQAALKEIDLHAELDAVLAILAPRMQQIEVKKNYCEGVPRVTAFAAELNQAWTNLIENAIDAMPSGGKLTISTECDDYVVSVEIADTGIGVPAEIQDCIFDPFFTTKGVGEGYGLGLDFVHRTIVRRCHGAIHFTSQPGETRFRVQLPVSSSSSATLLPEPRG